MKYKILSLLFLTIQYNLFAQSAKELKLGEAVFEQNCTSCHNFKQDGIGPQLGGLGEKLSTEWVLNFLKNPQKAFEQGDTHVTALVKKYGTIMPGFEYLGQKKLKAVANYLLAQPAPVFISSKLGNSLTDPIPNKIQKSGITLKLKPVLKFPATSDRVPTTRLIKMAENPATQTDFVADLQGQLYYLASEGPVKVLEMMDHFDKFINTPGLATGLGSFVFHPEYRQNGLFYTSHTENANAAPADFQLADSIKHKLQYVITQWKVSEPSTNQMVAEPQKELFRVEMATQIHGVQDLAFNPLAKPGEEDYGLLFIGIGDGGAVEQGFDSVAHFKNRIWGNVIRIDPLGNNSKNGRYGIPPNNPFVNDGLGEIYAMGFRNPNKFEWTSKGELLVTNIGQNHIEAVYMVKKGSDAGWPLREGRFVLEPFVKMSAVFPIPAEEEIKYNYPVAQYDHDEGNAIIGVYEYKGTKVESLKGKIVFGDIVKGRLFYVMAEYLNPSLPSEVLEFDFMLNDEKILLEQLTKTKKVDMRLFEDKDGELYVVTRPDGMMYRLEK